MIIFQWKCTLFKELYTVCSVDITNLWADTAGVLTRISNGWSYMIAKYESTCNISWSPKNKGKSVNAGGSWIVVYTAGHGWGIFFLWLVYCHRFCELLSAFVCRYRGNCLLWSKYAEYRSAIIPCYAELGYWQNIVDYILTLHASC